MRNLRLAFILLLLGLVATASCDCEGRVRRMLRGGAAGSDEDAQAELRRAAGESSAPREVEPNDDPAQATPLQLGADTRPVQGSISDARDHDWFALRAPQGESWQLELVARPVTPALDLVLRVEVPGSPGAPLEYNLAGPGEPESVPILAVGDQPLRIMVLGANQTTGDYEIIIQKRLSGGAIEAEPNDDVGAATPFEAPGSIEGFYDRPEDRDIFYIPAGRLTDTLYQLEVTPLPGITQQVRVYTRRELHSEYLRFQVGPERPAGLPNLRIPPQAEGVWLVLSAGENYSRTKSYRVQFLAHPPTDAVVEAEPNDTAQTAQAILVGTRLAGYFHVPEDVDHFAIYTDALPGAPDTPTPDEPANTGTTQRLAPREEPAAGVENPGGGRDDNADSDGDLTDELAPTLPVDLLDAIPDKQPPAHLIRVSATPRREGARIGLVSTLAAGTPGPSAVSEPGREAILCNIPLGEGSLGVELRPVDYPAGAPRDGFDYELVMEDIARTPGLEVEPNDTAAQADKLYPGAARVGYVTGEQDVDVFAFALPPAAPTHPAADPADEDADETPRTIEVLLGANPANLAFDLRDDEGGIVARVDRAGPGGEERLKIDLPPGLYFIHVTGTQTRACKPYDLSYRLLP